ncbi:MAG: spermidine synthase [Thermoplasmata archaeon]|nr:spermidine synthase [Thermoplasmata archaeon]
MEWFVERHDGTGFMVRGKKIAEHEGKQKIEIFDTSLGKMLVIDGKIQLTEADEFFYHEMLVHVPMMMHSSPKKVLIIGGGDGGTAREVLKHDPEMVKIVEIDRAVVELCRKHLRIDDNAFDDERVEIIYRDGMEFVRECDERYDVIIVDGSDPDAASMPLVSKEFYSKCAELCDIFVTQSQSPLFQKEYFNAVLRNSTSFSFRRIYLSFVPSYPSGMWSFLLASGETLKMDMAIIKKRYEERGIKTRYYTPSMHLSSFALPGWLEEVVRKYGIGGI